MRTREVGGYEPDDREQHELSELWHTSRTAIALPGPERQALFDKHGGERGARIAWIVDEFMRTHAGEPNVKFKWVYNWCVEYLGRHVIEARTVTVKDSWGHARVVGGFGDVGTGRRDLDRDERLFAEANAMLDQSVTEIRAAFFRATPNTPEHKRYVVLRDKKGS